MRLLRTGLLLATLVWSAFGQARPAVAHLGDSWFRHNAESLLFSITYLGITAGYARMSVEHVSNDARAPIRLVLRAWTTPFVSSIYRLDMTLTSRLAGKGLETVWYNEDRLERDRRFFHILDMAPDQRSYRYGTLSGGRTNFQTLGMAGPGFDALSCFYVARCLQGLEPGAVFEMPVTYHEKGRRVEVRVIERKEIKTRWGKVKTVVVLPKMDFQGIFLNSGEMFIYLSDDDRHVPVLMESKLIVGSFRANLIDGFPGTLAP